MPDKMRFRLICHDAMMNGGNSAGIGTLQEKLMHVILKQYMDGDKSHHECFCCGCVADILSGKEVTEIQTGGFFHLKKKLPRMLDAGFHVTVVYPVAARKWMLWIDPENGEISARRRSPKKSGEEQLLLELIHLLPLLGREGLSFKVLLLEVEEYRKLDGWSYDRKRGSTRCERIPVDLLEESDFPDREAFRKFVSDDLPERFTTGEFAKSTGLTRHRAQTALRVLRELEVITPSGRISRENAFERK